MTSITPNAAPPTPRALPQWKRLLDVVVGTCALLLALPVIACALLLVVLSDGHNPLYISNRVGLNGRAFRLIKIRTMIINASANCVDTTIAGDVRVLPVGRLIRRLKLDELPQFWHVIRGEMSLVGPRPNVERETVLYTSVEQRLLAVPPGITDFASIVFADLADVLAGSADPNLAYNQLVRPSKSALGLYYIDSMSPGQDIALLFYTLTASVARNWTLQQLSRRLRRQGAPEHLCHLTLRRDQLVPTAPPGAEHIVTSREPQSLDQARSRA